MNQTQKRTSVDIKSKISNGLQPRAVVLHRSKKCYVCNKLIAADKYVFLFLLRKPIAKPASGSRIPLPPIIITTYSLTRGTIQSRAPLHPQLSRLTLLFRKTKQKMQAKLKEKNKILLPPNQDCMSITMWWCQAKPHPISLGKAHTKTSLTLLLPREPIRKYRIHRIPKQTNNYRKNK